MPKKSQILKMFSKIQVIRSPKHRLSTFGETPIRYYLVTDVAGFADRARLRTGIVVAEKPSIITAESLKNKFEGFGAASQKWAEWLVSQYGQALKGLTYQFKNKPDQSRVELLHPDQLTKRIADQFDRTNEPRTVLLRGTDKVWQLSLMKFIVEETLASFSSNIQELDERGFFQDDEERREKNHHREIQNLLQKAGRDSSLVPLLARRLKEYGLFDRYQDQFFRLVK